MQRLADAQDAFARAYRARGAGNPYEAAQVNSDTCSAMPLLMPPDAVMHDTAYPLFPHYVHEERLYLMRNDEGAHAGGRLLKQLSGNAAQRESAALSALGAVRGGAFAPLFPRVFPDEALRRVSEGEGRGAWGAYGVELVRTVAAGTHLCELAARGDAAGLGAFLNDTLGILEALRACGLRHNALDARRLLVSHWGRAVLVDAEIAQGMGLPPPSSASMEHARDLHERGAPSDAVSLGRSLQRLLHPLNVSRFDCLLRLLVTETDDPPPPHVTDGHARTDALHAALEAALGGGGEACEVPPARGWSAYHEERVEGEAFAGDVHGLGVEPAGAPPFEHSMALYEMDVLLLPGSGLPAQRLAEFFYGMGGEQPAVQDDARALYSEALGAELAFKASARASEFVAANTLCCWARHAHGVAHARAVIANASACRAGTGEACRGARAAVVPSIDALAQGYSLAELLALHRAWADWFSSRIPPVHWGRVPLKPRARAGRLTVVYASSHTFQNHGSHYTLMRVFEEHDDTRVDVVHLLMVAEQDIERAEGLPSRHTFINIAHMSDSDAARKINDLGAHILVDLNGYLSGTRLSIAALQPAPICLHHFAQPSTMGARYVHNFLADAVIVPPEHAPHYTEAINYIPRIFISTSARRFSAEAQHYPPDRPYPRTGLDLPIFPEALMCSFNAFYKVQPTQFAVWTRVLRARPHASLVLRAKAGAPAECIVREMESAGLQPDRVHFTGDLSGEAHARRCAACELVVDTDHFNGITTTATALWSGSPVVTFATENNSGRCAAAMLLSMGINELLARDRVEYEELLLILTGPRGSQFLSRMRSKIASERMVTPLFRPKHMARGYERVFGLLWDMYLAAGSRAGTHHSLLAPGSGNGAD